jgi:hypothetical protein
MLAEIARRARLPPPPTETLEQRLANTVAIYRRHDRPADAERVQRRLDDLLKRKVAR